MIHAYLIHLLILIGIYIIFALSLQLSIGFTGLLNLGHIAFFAIGAYASALLSLNGIPFWISFLLAGGIAMIFGFLLSLPMNKIKGDYLALATMGFTFVIHEILLNWQSFTQGPLGLPGIPRPSLFGFTLTNNLSYLMLTLMISLFSYLILKKITSSPFGKILEAIRDDELATRILGKNTFKMKAISLGTAAFFAGIAGSLFAHYVTYIDPNNFTLLDIIPTLTIVIIGGLASLKGTVLAAILLILLPEPLRFLGLPSSMLGPLRQMLYALILLFILLYKPKGFFGKVELK